MSKNLINRAFQRKGNQEVIKKVIKQMFLEERRICTLDNFKIRIVFLKNKE